MEKVKTSVIGFRSMLLAICLMTMMSGLVAFKHAHRFADEFLQQLGISKADAESKIAGGFLYGSLDVYGLKNARNIAMGNRAAVTNDIMVYAKKYVGSSAFLKEYNDMKQKAKPELFVPQTPEAMQKEMIDQMKKSIADLQESIKKADASMKPMFENLLEDMKKQQAQVEDPKNPQIEYYRNSYPQFVKDTEVRNARLISDWEAKYPANHMLYVKQRLQQFLEETKDINFDAEVTEKNGKKYFVDKQYERKSNRWKMGYRAGKPVVETARKFVDQWMSEIK